MEGVVVNDKGVDHFGDPLVHSQWKLTPQTLTSPQSAFKYSTERSTQGYSHLVFGLGLPKQELSDRLSSPSQILCMCYGRGLVLGIGS